MNQRILFSLSSRVKKMIAIVILKTLNGAKKSFDSKTNPDRSNIFFIYSNFYGLCVTSNLGQSRKRHFQSRLKLLQLFDTLIQLSDQTRMKPWLHFDRFKDTFDSKYLLLHCEADFSNKSAHLSLFDPIFVAAPRASLAGLQSTVFS